MTKAQLETEIDRIKLMKQLQEDIPDYPPVKPGPLGPRPIPVAEAKTEDVTIAVPMAPVKHLTDATKPKKTKLKKGDTVQFEDVAELFPAIPVAASVRAHPTKALPSSSVAGKFSHPGAPKRSHTCNCPACPEKAVA